MKKNLAIMHLMSIAVNICAIIWNIAMLIMSPLYLIGLIFWKIDTSKELINDYYNSIAKLSND